MAKKTDVNTDANSVMEQQVTKEFRFKLSAEEKNTMADQAARMTNERETNETQFKEMAKAKRAELKAQQTEINRLLKSHLSGYEVREVNVTERLDWENKTVQYYMDGKLIEERAMHDAELQMKLNTNPTQKKVKKDNRTRAQKNPDKHLTPEELRSQQIADVHKLETGRKTKRSAVDHAETTTPA